MRRQRLAVRVLAVALLVLGIVVMHHVARPGHDGSGGQDAATMTAGSIDVVEHQMGANLPGSGVTADDSAASAGHGLLHLCLAVLTAAAVLLFGWFLLVPRSWRSTTPFVALRARPAPARPPPRPHGSALLLSLCVMRT